MLDLTFQQMFDGSLEYTQSLDLYSWGGIYIFAAYLFGLVWSKRMYDFLVQERALLITPQQNTFLWLLLSPLSVPFTAGCFLIRGVFVFVVLIIAFVVVGIQVVIYEPLGRWWKGNNSPTSQSPDVTAYRSPIMIPAGSLTASAVGFEVEDGPSQRVAGCRRRHARSEIQRLQQLVKDHETTIRNLSQANHEYREIQKDRQVVTISQHAKPTTTPQAIKYNEFFALLCLSRSTLKASQADADQDDAIAFPRILAEMYATGIDRATWNNLLRTTGYSTDDLVKKFASAEIAWENIKRKIPGYILPGLTK